MASVVARTLGKGCLALSLAGCQLVSGLGKLGTSPTANGGAGGATSTTDATGSSNATTGALTTGSSATTTTTGATTGKGATTSTSATTTVTASSSSGGPVDLVPCGNYTDTLQSLDPTKWAAQNAMAMGFQGVQIIATVQAGGHITLLSPGHYDECYVTIQIPLQQDQTTVFDGIVDQSAPNTNTASIGFTNYPTATLTMTVGGTMSTSMPVTSVRRLGIALHAGSVYFLHASGLNGGAWTFDGSVARPAWMGGNTDTANIGVTTTTNAQRNADVAGYNVRSILLSDLPPSGG